MWLWAVATTSACCWERQWREQAKAQPYLAGIGTATSLIPYPYKKVYTPQRTLLLVISDPIRQAQGLLIIPTWVHYKQQKASVSGAEGLQIFIAII